MSSVNDFITTALWWLKRHVFACKTKSRLVVSFCCSWFYDVEVSGAWSWQLLKVNCLFPPSHALTHSCAGRIVWLTEFLEIRHYYVLCVSILESCESCQIYWTFELQIGKTVFTSAFLMKITGNMCWIIFNVPVFPSWAFELRKNGSWIHKAVKQKANTARTESDILNSRSRVCSVWKCVNSFKKEKQWFTWGIYKK